MKNKKVRAAVTLGFFAVMFYVGIASAAQICVTQERCVDGPGGSSLCAFVEVCHDVAPTAH